MLMTVVNQMSPTSLIFLWNQRPVIDNLFVLSIRQLTCYKECFQTPQEVFMLNANTVNLVMVVEKSSFPEENQDIVL